MFVIDVFFNCTVCVCIFFSFLVLGCAALMRNKVYILSSSSSGLWPINITQICYATKTDHHQRKVERVSLC